VPVHTQGSLLGGRYRVLRHLGSGGMASVLLCRDERLDREVAVKRLHADSPVDVEQRFVREAKLGASLNHPNLVSVFDTATDEEGVLIVMEYVEGEALARTLKRGPLEPERVASVVRDVGSALDHAHAQGVVHRDVKPGNVLLRRDGVTKLVDLGIATAQDHTRLTHSGMVLGTAAYMAPEQLEGGETSAATDVYALAVVAYEALTGERAREGRTPLELAHRIATSPPPDLRDAMPSASPQAAAVLKRAMAREPRDRPASAGELARGLAGALEEPPTAPTRAVPRTRTAPRAAPVPVPPPEPAAAKPPPPTAPPRRAGPTPGKRPVGAIALALVFLVLAAAVVLAAVLSSGDDGGEPQQADGGRQEQQSDGARQRERQSEQQQQPQAEQQQPAEPAPAPAEEAEPPPQEQTGSFDPAGGAQLNEQGFALMQQGDYAGAVPILQEAVASWPEDSQDINYAYALFNLGKSLNRSGNPDAAIPYLEKRLNWSDQRETVQAELDLARRNAGGGGGGDD
jgi:tRNA A-37 threonylcarbamoyl transferase component Bud32/tetratricopeptide (TPR) repeat protein